MWPSITQELFANTHPSLMTLIKATGRGKKKLKRALESNSGMEVHGNACGRATPTVLEQGLFITRHLILLVYPARLLTSPTNSIRSWHFKHCQPLFHLKFREEILRFSLGKFFSWIAIKIQLLTMLAFGEQSPIWEDFALQQFRQNLGPIGHWEIEREGKKVPTQSKRVCREFRLVSKHWEFK